MGTFAVSVRDAASRLPRRRRPVASENPGQP
jgi:hypothetical protein